MPVFKNQENQSFELLPEGDYVFTVIEMESGIQTGNGKTAGSPFWELKLKIEGKNAHVWERLIDHESCSFKIDTFLKSTGAAPQAGVAFEFDAAAAESAGVLHIDPVGLRGWCKLNVDTYTPPGKPPIKRNKVQVFYTDKPKLDRAAKPETVAVPAAAPAIETSDDDIPF